MIEEILLLSSIIFLLMYFYDKKRFSILKYRKTRVSERNTKQYSEIQNSLRSGAYNRFVFVLAVFLKKDLSYTAGRIKPVIFSAALSDVLILSAILAAGQTVILRLLILICGNAMIWRLLTEMSVYRFRRDIHKFVISLQNELLQENEIITCVKRTIDRSEKTFLSSETEMILNEIVKNAGYPEQKYYKFYFEKTSGFELPLLLIFISSSYVSGNRQVMMRNLRELERYCLYGFECSKDYLFSKLPYMVMILLMPAFLFWMDSFGADMMAVDAAAKEPKEYIFLFSILLIFLFSGFKGGSS